jgi:hypothetical protein
MALWRTIGARSFTLGDSACNTPSLGRWGSRPQLLLSHAAPVTLGGDTLQRAVAGKTVHLDTPLGVAIPITYHANGIMSGKAGVLEYFLGAEADRADSRGFGGVLTFTRL